MEFMGQSCKTYTRVIQYSLIVLFIGGIFLFAYFQRGIIYAELDALKLIPRPERFTELYFENHTQLPAQISTTTPLTFSFVIHNLEGADMIYPYNVYIKDSYGTTTLAQASILVKNNAYETITQQYALKSTNSEKTLFVNLPSKHQELHFKFEVSDTK